MNDTPRTDEVMRIADNFGAYRGSDGSDGVTAQEAHDDCFTALERLARTLERERDRLADTLRGVRNSLEREFQSGADRGDPSLIKIIDAALPELTAEGQAE